MLALTSRFFSARIVSVELVSSVFTLDSSLILAPRYRFWPSICFSSCLMAKLASRENGRLLEVSWPTMFHLLLSFD